MEVWNTVSGEQSWVGVLFQDGNTAAFNSVGRFLHGDASVIESEFVYLVEQPSGKIEVLRPSAFSRRVSRSLMSRRE